jgi:hypothetical protein
MGASFFLKSSISSIRALNFASHVKKTKSSLSSLAIGWFVGMIDTFKP